MHILMVMPSLSLPLSSLLLLALLLLLLLLFLFLLLILCTTSIFGILIFSILIFSILIACYCSILTSKPRGARALCQSSPLAQAVSPAVKETAVASVTQPLRV